MCLLGWGWIQILTNLTAIFMTNMTNLEKHQLFASHDLPAWKWLWWRRPRSQYCCWASTVENDKCYKKMRFQVRAAVFGDSSFGTPYSRSRRDCRITKWLQWAVAKTKTKTTSWNKNNQTKTSKIEWILTFCTEDMVSDFNTYSSAWHICLRFLAARFQWLSDLDSRFKIVLLLSLQSTKDGSYGMAKIFVEVLDIDWAFHWWENAELLIYTCYKSDVTICIYVWTSQSQASRCLQVGI